MENPRDAWLEEYLAKHDPEIRDSLRAIAGDIKQAVDDGRKIGFDVGKHWRDLLATLPDTDSDQAQGEEDKSDHSKQ